MTDPENATLALRIQELAESGNYEGFNAIVGALVRDKAFEEHEIEVIKRDVEFRNKITDVCYDASKRKHKPRGI